jgi:predicted lipoprotein with Yx(FWY)xxD motif
MRMIRVASSVATAAVLAACARSDRAGDTTSSSGMVVDSAATPPAAVTAGLGADSTGAVVTAVEIRTASAPAVGIYLTDANGRSLYMFEKDAKNVSNCTGACAAAWPPLIAGAQASSDAAISAAKLGTATRGDSTKQATYGGMPLYRYEDDEKAGDIKGQGKFEFGGSWYLVSPEGKKIEKRG